MLQVAHPVFGFLSKMTSLRLFSWTSSFLTRLLACLFSLCHLPHSLLRNLWKQRHLPLIFQLFCVLGIGLTMHSRLHTSRYPPASAPLSASMTVLNYISALLSNLSFPYYQPQTLMTLTHASCSQCTASFSPFNALLCRFSPLLCRVTHFTQGVSADSWWLSNEPSDSSPATGANCQHVPWFLKPLLCFQVSPFLNALSCFSLTIVLFPLVAILPPKMFAKAP